MKRPYLITAAAVLLAAVAFIAGRASIGDGPAAVEKTTAVRIKSGASLPSPAAPGEITKNVRPVASPAESARALLNQLANMPVTQGDGRTLRPVLVLLEQLSRMGAKALPAVGGFLDSGADVSYMPTTGKRLRDVKSLVNALVPPSLRFGLFDLVAQAGGKDAEAILAENLGRTKSGLEVAYLSELLRQSSPGNYQKEVISAATRLLAKGDAADRNLLFDVMKDLGDTSYVATARREMIQPDGKIDRDALRYLQQAMGAQSLALAAQSYRDPRLVEPGSKEPLARLALNYVGADPQALDLYHAALMDPALLPDQKRELVEDLNQDGLSNRKTPTAGDLQIIAQRHELTQAYLQQDYVRNDAILNAAFHEADKDLRKMLERAANAPPP